MSLNKACLLKTLAATKSENAMSLETEVYEFERRVANLERELKRLHQQEQRLREQHELVVTLQQSLCLQQESRKLYVELDEQNEALTKEIVEIIHAEVLIDGLIETHRRYLVKLRRYRVRLKRSQMRSGLNCQNLEKNARS
jgi:hypothetical protein